jgi:hypothetical protein
MLNWVNYLTRSKTAKSQALADLAQPISMAAIDDEEIAS